MIYTKYPDNFLMLPDEWTNLDKAEVLISQIGYEGTASWKKGTAKGPDAIIQASQQVEFFDIETRKEPYLVGICTMPALKIEATPEIMMDSIFRHTNELLDTGKFIATLGGEHSITGPIVKAHIKKYPKMGVLQFDAHADLRDEYSGTKHSHAAVMSRVHEVCDAVAVGIRSYDKEQHELVQKKGYKIFHAQDIVKEGSAWMDEVIAALPEEVYVTIDLDVFDPSIMSATGTPEPGGLDYYTVTGLLKKVCEKKKVVGLDIVELSPTKNHSCDFLAARLLYKLIGYIFLRKL